MNYTGSKGKLAGEVTTLPLRDIGRNVVYLSDLDIRDSPLTSD